MAQANVAQQQAQDEQHEEHGDDDKGVLSSDELKTLEEQSLNENERDPLLLSDKTLELIL